MAYTGGGVGGASEVIEAWYAPSEFSGTSNARRGSRPDGKKLKLTAEEACTIKEACQSAVNREPGYVHPFC